MKVSLITVTYNSSRFVEDCIRSVMAQTHTDIEYIVIDGKSTDETVSIIKKYDSQIDTWISEPDNGIYDAINKGMKLATGQIIGILNSDDMLASPDTISEIVKSFQRNKVDSIYGDLVYVDQQDTSKTIRSWMGKTYSRNSFKHGWMPAHPTFYVRREIIEGLGGYNPLYFSAADYEFMTRCLFKHRISSFYHSKLIVKMRMGGVSNNSLYQRLIANRRDYLAMKRNLIPFPLLVSILKPLIKIPQFIKKMNFNTKKKMLHEIKQSDFGFSAVTSLILLIHASGLHL